MAKSRKVTLVITGWDSTRKICEYKIPAGCIGDKNLEALLRTLTAKHAKLTDEEIIGSYSKKNVKAYQPHLEMTRQGHPKWGLSCGDNPWFAVRSIIED